MKTATQQNMSPYPGLRPFKSAETELFFGREEHVAQLLKRLSYSRSVTVTGVSGCGKTSLIQAGLIPALDRQEVTGGTYDWRIAIMQPGTDPFRNLAEALLSDTALGKEAQAGIDDVLEFLRSDSQNLVEALHEASLPPQTLFLLVIDQFEDIFQNNTPQMLDEMKKFVKLLITSGNQQDNSIYILTALRSGFLGTCSRFQGLPEMINSGLFLVPDLNHEQQEAAIRRPVEIAGGTIEPEVITRLLEDTPAEPASLPIFQHCLRRMWLHAGSGTNVGDKVTVTLDDYETIGGIKQALFNHADEMFQKLKPLQQQIAPLLFRRLTESFGVQLHEIASMADVPAMEVIQVAEVFRDPDAGFLTPDSSLALTPESRVCLRYTPLFREWSRQSEPVVSKELQKPVAPKQVHGVEVSKQPQQRGRRKSMMTGIVILTGLVAVLTIIAASQWRKAEQQAFIAEQYAIEVKQQTARAETQQVRAEEEVAKLRKLQQQLELFKNQPVQQNIPAMSDTVPAIRRIDLKDAHGAIIPAVGEVYYIEVGEQVTLEIDLHASPSQIIIVQYSAERGIIKHVPNSINATYIAPDTSGRDTVKIFVSKGNNENQQHDQATVKIEQAIVKTIEFKVF